ncbi:MAG: 4Fe-4S binding protein [Candidatus Eremiobacteraeota bacterium]|nr:4Fe-4S binding protein [Candidatus Eremiobacteraeota bacterium]
MPVAVDLELCIGSGDCVKACAFNAVDVIDGKAVIYENCTDCDACVRACPTHAIASATPKETSAGNILAVDFSERSGIAAALSHVARRIGAGSVELRVNPLDAGAAADLLAHEAESAGARLIVLPHEGPGPAIAARVAARLNGALLSGCSDLSVDDSGGVRATRLAYGGIVKLTSRAGPGTVVATLFPRSRTPYAARPLDGQLELERTGEAPSRALADARTVVARGASLATAAREATRALADILGANIIEGAELKGKTIAPELYIAIGVEGSTETNAAVNGAGTIVALVGSESDPTAQIADYVLTGDVETNVKALLAAL